MLTSSIIETRLRTLTTEELALVAGGLSDDGGGDGGGGGGGGDPGGGGSNPPPGADPSWGLSGDDPAHWFDNAGSSKTFYDDDLRSFETDYFNDEGWYMGSTYTAQDLTPDSFVDPNSDPGGWFVTVNGGEGVIGGLSIAYSNDVGLEVFADVGFGTSGIVGGYTNDVDGYLGGWSESVNSDFGLGDGMSLDFQSGALTIGSPGVSVTDGASWDDINNQLAIWGNEWFDPPY